VSGVEGTNGEYALGSGESLMLINALLENRTLLFIREQKSKEKSARLRKKNKKLARFEERRKSA
jgi:hypothetical protein